MSVAGWGTIVRGVRKDSHIDLLLKMTIETKNQNVMYKITLACSSFQHSLNSTVAPCYDIMPRGHAECRTEQQALEVLVRSHLHAKGRQ